MEADPQRWAVTYTKHLTQKRKAYHDGELILHPDSGRLVLLDDAGKTLESRYLRSSEEVSAGAALSFHSYLVDVGELEACPAESRSSSSSAAGATSRTAQRGGARARPPSAAGRLNPRAPREFVNPPNRCGGASSRESEAPGPGGADEAGSRSQEWTALYTAQLTQKAKKYHDGVVRLVKAGPHVEQIMLLDEDGQVLGSRHLKSGETIESGKKCIFPNYLIEICEAKVEKEGIHNSGEPMVQSSAKSGGNTSNKMGLNSVNRSKKFISSKNLHVIEKESEVTVSSHKLETGQPKVVTSGSSGSHMGTDSCFKEWSALYTTQLTQKAKKYHDGVIRLIVGSHARQIILLDEDGEMLGSRYLKSIESVESGTKCQIPNYLIEVCEIRNQKNEGMEEVSQVGQKSEENSSDRTGVKSKSPKFVSPFKFQDARKGNCESNTIFNRPPVTCNKMNSHSNDTAFRDIQRSTSTNSVWPEVGKTLSTNVHLPTLSTNVGDQPNFCDFQDGKSRCLTNFIRKEAGISTFSNMDDSIRTASQILSIMRPPSEDYFPQTTPGPAHSLVSPNSRIPIDSRHTNNSVLDNSNRTFNGHGHSGSSHFATQLRTPAQSSLDSSHTNNYMGTDSSRACDGSGHSGLSHFATQLRTSVQSCLNLESSPQRNSLVSHPWNESSGDSHPTQNIMRPAAFQIENSTMIDILASDVSNAKEQKIDSSNHHMGNYNDTVLSDPGLQEEKSGTEDQLWSESSVVDWKCDGRVSTSAYTLTCKDPKIQELIDDCPSFDLGF